ncbi:transposase [Bacillus cereus]|uniref:transposase n=1 Tax=Bacillus TaxID=1386 RepID=UPI0009E057BC|nr:MULTISPECIES: transposase [unclassified Bacillus (in: firmicutes)]
MKEQFWYIVRYIRRPAIDLKRIDEYDGQSVSLLYMDKIDDVEKIETLYVKEFISGMNRPFHMSPIELVHQYKVKL